MINLRGTNGSGKSTVFNRLLKAWKVREIRSRYPRMPEAYELRVAGCAKPAFIIGPYVTSCGGCDQIQPYDELLEMIPRYAKQGHVLYEGVIISSVYGKVGAMMERWGKEAVMLFLDTPLEECIRRVQGRRDSRADDREFNPKNLTLKFNSQERIKKKVEEAGIIRMGTVSTENADKVIVKLLQGAR